MRNEIVGSRLNLIRRMGRMGRIGLMKRMEPIINLGNLEHCLHMLPFLFVAVLQPRLEHIFPEAAFFEKILFEAA